MSNKNAAGLLLVPPFLCLTWLMAVSLGKKRVLVAPSLPAFTRTVSSPDMEFGRGQVDQVLTDRPEMKSWVRQGDAVYEWEARQLGGAATGRLTYWDSTPPNSTIAEAENHPPTGLSFGKIRIRDTHIFGLRKGQKLTGEEMWACLVFESFNISNFALFAQNDEEALKGTISKQQWVAGTTKIEFQALQKTKEFYQTTWLPMQSGKGLATDPTVWFVNVPDDYTSWIAHYTDPAGYPYEYLKSYNEYIAPGLPK